MCDYAEHGRQDFYTIVLRQLVIHKYKQWADCPCCQLADVHRADCPCSQLTDVNWADCPCYQITDVHTDMHKTLCLLTVYCCDAIGIYSGKIRCETVL